MNNEEQKELSPKELYELKKANKEQVKKKEQVSEKVKTASKKIVKYILYILITIGVISGLGWLILRTPNLPPISMQNHIEESPESHILTSPIPDRIQRHMLEHADGTGKPGIIIQYNCDDYKCEEDLIQKLTTLVEEYPENVYLAPNNYDGKIILTKLNKRKVLEDFDEQAIINFIK